MYSILQPFAVLVAILMGCQCCDAQVFRGRSTYGATYGYGYQQQPRYYYPAQQYYTQPAQPSYSYQPYQPMGFNPNAKVDGASAYNVERMPELPTGTDKLEVWVVLSPNWQQSRLETDIVNAVNRDPRMQQIKRGTRFNYYVSTNPLFSQSPLIQRVGTATPIFVVTGPGGEIANDGSAGLFMNASNCPKTAGDCIDLLCDSIERYNPPKKFEGQTNDTPLMREITFPNLASVGSQAEQDCNPDGTCDPVDMNPPPSGQGTMPLIVPPRVNIAPSVGLLGSMGLAVALLFLGVKTPFKPRVVT